MAISRMDRVVELASQIAHAQNQITAIQIIPAEDTYDDGAVIRVRVRAPGADNVLTYILLKVCRDNGDVRWYFTGRLYRPGIGWSHQSFPSWDALMEWVLSGALTVIEWTQFFSGSEIDDRVTVAIDEYRRETTPPDVRPEPVHMEINQRTEEGPF